jgi:hypothetical protein
MGGLKALKLSSLKSPKQPHTAGHSYQSLGAGARRQQADAPVKDNFVPITGLVHNQTSLGVFIEIARRRVFVPSNCMSSPSAGFEAGEPAVLLVLRRFAEQERLIPSEDSPDRVCAKPVTEHATIQNSGRKAKPPSRLRWLRDRLIAMCVVETTAATQSGMSSWKTKPCRLLLRLLTKRVSSAA